VITYAFAKPRTQVHVYTVTSPAQRQAELLGLNMVKLLALLPKASPVKASYGNARYGQWLFTLKGKTLTNIVKLPSAMVSLFDVQDTKQTDPESFVMWEEHEPCGGKGCDQCQDGEVQVVRRIKK